jgi:hypothetical protein
MRQSISGVTTSDKYYVTAQLSQPSFSPGVCRFVIKQMNKYWFNATLRTPM